VKRWILLKNAFSQEGGVCAHVVVDGAEFGHTNPQLPSNEVLSSTLLYKTGDQIRSILSLFFQTGAAI
jgi:hypothetical protein